MIINLKSLYFISKLIIINYKFGCFRQFIKGIKLGNNYAA